MSTASSRLQRRRLDNILVDEGLVSKENAQEALNIQKCTGETLGEILVDIGSIAGPDISKVICLHYQLPFISLKNYEFDPKLLGLFPPDFLHQHKLLPFDCVGEMLLCAVTEIPGSKVLTEIPKITKRKVALFVAYLEEIDKHLQEHCPLAEDSELLKRRRAMKSGVKPKVDTAEADKVFTEQSGEDLIEALDSTWDSIFQSADDKEEGSST